MIDILEIIGSIAFFCVIVPPILFGYFRYLDFLVEKIKGDS
jgi:hypothetical protein